MVKYNKLVDGILAELAHENKEYFENFAQYVRKNAFYAANRASEEMLQEVGQDILMAQADGVSAEVFFGKNPKEIADEMLADMNVDSNKAYFSKVFFGILNLFLFISMISITGWSDDFRGFVPLVFMLIISVVVSLFALFQRKTYEKKMMDKQNKILLAVIIVVGIIGMALLIFFVNHTSVPFPPHKRIPLIIITIILAAVITFKKKEVSYRMRMLPSFVVCALNGLLGIAAHSHLRVHMNEDIHLAIFLINVLIMAVLTFHFSKKLKHMEL